jgi:twinkle protein
VRDEVHESEIHEYVATKGWEAKAVTEASGRHLSLRCPLPACEGKRRRTLYINLEREGAWDCKRCGEHGAGLWSLRHVLGDTYSVNGTHGGSPVRTSKRRIRRRGETPSKPTLGEEVVVEAERLLWSDEGAGVRSYLMEERRLPEEELRRWRIGASRQSCGMCVAIPVWGGDGWATIKYRTVPPAERRMFRWAGTPSALFRAPGETLDPGKPIVIVEGELDAIALCAYGHTNVVSSTTGASGTWVDEWLDQLGENSQVVLAMDADEAGESGAQRLAKTIGLHRCSRAKPPSDHKDWNDALIAGVSAADVASEIHDASPYRPEEIQGAPTYFGQLDSLRLRPDSAFGASTGWASLDDLIRGIRLDELTVVTGDTGSGKTTFCAALALNLARNPGWPVLVAPFETRPGPVVQKWVGMEAGGEPLTIETSVYEQAKGDISRLPLYVLDKWGEVDLPTLCASIQWAVAHLGVKLVVLDHLHFFLQADPRYERHGIDAVMKRLSLLASDLGIHIVLVVHPRTTESDNERIGMAQLKGSSGIKQIASNVLAIWRHRAKDRNKKDDTTPKAVVTVLKCRADVGEEGSTVLEFENGSCRYRDID